jgi:single-strand DNA-binding protein
MQAACMGGLVYFYQGDKEMNNLNSILIEGNLVRDVETRTTSKGTSVSVFSIASNRYYKLDNALEKEVSFFDVESWGKLADRVSEIGRKGRGVRVVGRIKQDRWQDRDGKTQSKVSIVAEHVEFRPDFKNENTVTETGKTETAEYAEEALAENMVPSF